MTNLLSGHLALVTGAASGIGRGIAIGFAKAGARVVAADLDGEGAARTAREIGADASSADAGSYEIDVADNAACAALAARVAGEVGQVSILVNNAGIVRRATLSDETAVEDWKRTLAVNLDGAFNMTWAFLDHLKSTKGRVISTGSIQSFVHTGNSVAYTASKSGIRGLTLSLAAELAPYGIRVNAIGPGFIRTPLNDQAVKNNPAMMDRFMQHTPLGRPGTPDDLVGPAVFLASDMSAYVTGVTLPVDGGYLTV